MSSLELCEVVKHYRGSGETVRAVDGVSLEISSGEMVALYGPSGSGKTTLLLMAAGLIAPDSGRVMFDGRNLTDMTPVQGDQFRLREVGFVFQEFHLAAGASALSNAALKLLAQGLSLREAEKLAWPWLQRVGLAMRASHPPERLSRGERQRVAIARALVNEPKLLLADEPTGNLDSQRGSEILGLLRDICHERKIPALIVTHDPQATMFVDRAHTLRDGVLHDGLQASLGQALL
ncbi:MAG: ABC transporter ATP-binding protein [Solirubrobacteraceae bacterium]